jgi:hypothetical protein
VAEEPLIRNVSPLDFWLGHHRNLNCAIFRDFLIWELRVISGIYLLLYLM